MATYSIVILNKIFRIFILSYLKAQESKQYSKIKYRKSKRMVDKYFFIISTFKVSRLSLVKFWKSQQSLEKTISKKIASTD